MTGHLRLVKSLQGISTNKVERLQLLDPKSEQTLALALCLLRVVYAVYVVSDLCHLLSSDQLSFFNATDAPMQLENLSCDKHTLLNACTKRAINLRMVRISVSQASRRVGWEISTASNRVI